MKKLVIKKGFVFSSKKTILTSAVLSCVYGSLLFLFFHYLFYACRTIFINLSFNINPNLTFENLFNILYFFAVISFLAAFAIFLRLYVQSKHSQLELRRHHRVRILNDQSFLFAGFFHWSIKLMFSFFITLVLSYYPNLLDDIGKWLALLLLVLFLDIPKYLGRKMKTNYRVRFLIYSFLTITILSSIYAYGGTKILLFKNKRIVSNSNYIELPSLQYGSIESYDERLNINFGSIRFKYSLKFGEKPYIFQTGQYTRSEVIEEIKRLYGNSNYRQDLVIFADNTFSAIERFALELDLQKTHFTKIEYVFSTPPNEFGYKDYNTHSKNLHLTTLFKDNTDDIIEVNINNFDKAINTSLEKRDSILIKGIRSGNTFCFASDLSTSHDDYLEFIVNYKNFIVGLRNKYVQQVNPACIESYLYGSSKPCRKIFDASRSRYPFNYIEKNDM